MKRAAIGVRMHSGWGALVAVCNNTGTVEVIQRQRVAIVAPRTRGGNQPYHFAKSLDPPEAEQFLGDYFVASKRVALAAVRDLVGELSGQYRVVGSAVLLASGRPLPPLAKILASHALIHAAEGEFFREAFSKACESLDLPVTGFRERDLDACVQTTFGKVAARMEQQISTLGRSVGPPWTKDQKLAALAALVVLATEASREAAQESESKRRNTQNRSEPRSGARMQPTASAVGSVVRKTKPQGGDRN